MKVVQMNNVPKAVVMNTAVLIEQNYFSKSFEYGLTTKLFIGKAYDEESGKHFLVNSIPELLNCHNIQYPIIFDEESARDLAFVEMDTEYAAFFIEQLSEELKFRNRQNEESLKAE